ncbi:GWxTD domain-containing protein [candidate division KSB1 bacterium]|nr:GWxTD domain-containing protein [candidate division KSB1 bacterium]NIT73948.1 GWxTD domain-containing protein [candidate division KSB1 bacterium]NIU89247.1 GWxTD domain-containing protein [candidate division KSB1 bacterium]NIX73628.1 GWxTD domain-containing protein [candidate division KSB1 bacterium]
MFFENLFGNRLRWLILPSILTVSPIPAQDKSAKVDSSTFVQTFGKPLFIYDTYTFPAQNTGKSQVRIFVRFVNDILQFVKVNEADYQARYEVSTEILDEDGGHVAGDIWRQKIATRTYEETNSRNAVNQHEFTFNLEAGSYELRIEVTDLETKRHLVRKDNIDIRNLPNNKIGLSDIIFVDSIKMDSSGITHIVPNMTKTYEEPTSEFAGYFELVSGRQDSVKLRVRIYDEENNALFDDSKAVLGERKRYSEVVKIKGRIETPGHYFFVVEARTLEEKVMVRQDFFIQYAEKKPSLDHTSPALLHAMKYICDSDDYKLITEASGAARRNLIDTFWQQRDPMPKTAENELREEFRRRVEFTMRHFSVTTEGKPGWQTDRGRIYILYGQPSEVRRRSVDIDSNPYEFWYYNDIDRRFVFLDKSGKGAYRLVHKD